MDGIIGAAAQTGMIINVQDAYQDSRFNPTLDQQSGLKHLPYRLKMPMAKF